ncbi:hypothetical protein EDC04DRAFT_2889790 [Pisolithus marmoratus]|nr:hypothetical protein EDC04DRAFT_2889790 [Pisolithus marmoratus]
MSSTHSFSNDNLSDLDDHPRHCYPDDREANPIQLSFDEFCIKADNLYAALQENTATPRQEAFAAKEFYRFVLAGHTCTPDGDTAHITLNACDALPDNVQYEVSQDYDSLIGVSDDLLYSTHLQLTPVPPFKLTLKTDNHMKSTAYLNLALDKFTDVLHMDKVDVNNWYIDVALEFGHDSHVVTWCATSHETLLAYCLPSVDLDDIDAIVKRTTFHVNHMMHLKDLTGFRYAPGIKG